MTDFVSAFMGAFLLNATLTFRSSDLWKQWFLASRSSSSKNGGHKDDNDLVGTDAAAERAKQEKWKHLIVRYLIVYLLATAADWLQGAYIFILYHAFGYSKYDIGVLFIAGFGSSAVFGSFVGGMADTKGRRLFVVVYGAAYALSCVTKRE